MKTKKIVSLVLASMLAVSSFTACAGKKSGKIVDMTMFAAMAGKEKDENNEIKEIIAEKTGVRVKESWLTGQTAGEAIGSIIASGKLPDFIDGGDGCPTLYENHLLVAWDDYLEKYPNLKEMYTKEEWDQFRQSDGKIYWANVFGNHYKTDTTTGHNGEAFWIQARVLEAYGYPKIETLDQYFEILEKYAKEHPTLPDGTPVIAYTCLCEDWKYYCIENAPMFLDGYPNDGCVIVNIDDGADKPKVVDYNTTDTAKKYFKKLNEEYAKGNIDPDFAVQTYDEYIAKLSTGAVLGMCDQNWDFNYTITPIFASTGLADLGCEYVPLGLMADGVTQQRWHTYGDTVNASSGCAVTTACEDPDRAFQFLSDILNQDIHDLRYWGVEGVDYLVDEDGLYYRTQEMRDKLNDTSYKASHVCNYSYMPQWLGTSKDGKNAMQPAEQASEFYAGLSEPLANCFKAYNAGGYPDMIGSIEEDVNATHPWFPMWSWSNELNNDTPGGVAWGKMGETKHKWLPKVVMASDFDSEWANYMDAYNACKPEDFLNEAQETLDARLAAYNANK